MENQEIISTESAIELPNDQYAHPKMATEWWWHVGTLITEDSRTLGFEVHAARFPIPETQKSVAVTQISITDIENKRFLQKNTVIGICPDNWAEKDPQKPWYVALSASGSPDGAVWMKQLDHNPLNMHVVASFTDDESQNTYTLDLILCQKGNPLLLWGNGEHKVDDKTNYYYSLTNLHTIGSITIRSGEQSIEDECLEVKGLTWMDHEYGEFPKNYNWVLQDMQLSNGIHLSNHTIGDTPEEGKGIESEVTLLMENGNSLFIENDPKKPSSVYTTPLAPTFISRNKIKYFLTFNIEISSPEVQASFLVSSLVPNQVLSQPGNKIEVYEGVANGVGTFNGEDVTANAWIEQYLVPYADVDQEFDFT